MIHRSTKQKAAHFSHRITFQIHEKKNQFRDFQNSYFLVNPSSIVTALVPPYTASNHNSPKSKVFPQFLKHSVTDYQWSIQNYLKKNLDRVVGFV